MSKLLFCAGSRGLTAMGNGGETALSIIFLVVSISSFYVQLAALSKLHFWPKAAAGSLDAGMYRGLLRTSICRFAAAVIYVGLAMANLTTAISPKGLAVASLIVFVAVQLIWQANAIADVRLRRHLAAMTAKHSSKP